MTLKVLTKKETLRTAIKTIVKDICQDVYYANDQYVEEKTEEILKEVSIRFSMGG